MPHLPLLGLLLCPHKQRSSLHRRVVQPLRHAILGHYFDVVSIRALKNVGKVPLQLLALGHRRTGLHWQRKPAPNTRQAVEHRRLPETLRNICDHRNEEAEFRDEWVCVLVEIRVEQLRQRAQPRAHWLGLLRLPGTLLLRRARGDVHVIEPRECVNQVVHGQAWVAHGRVFALG